MKLSVCMIVKNEEEMLAGALESVSGADEIIVCDTGSTDKTVEIASRYTEKVYTDFIWCDDFAAARNHACGKATGDWILTLDADERLDPGGVELIREAMATADKAINCKILSMADDKWREFRNIRVHRNIPEIEWKQPIHNYLNVTATDDCEAVIRFGYSPAHAKDPDRALRILTAVVERNPEAVRERYYLAREYWYRQEWLKAVEMIDDYLPRSSHVAERADAYLMQARCLKALSRYEDARVACMKAILNNANFKEAVLFMADLHWEHNAATWRKFAEICTNERVLFVRVK